MDEMEPTVPPEETDHDYAYFYGNLSLRSFLNFMTKETVDALTYGQADERKRLADDWRAASAHFQELQRAEAGWAEGLEIRPVPEALMPLASQVEADPTFQRAFSAVPVEIGLVELDRLVVWQNANNLVYIRQIQERLGPDPSPEAIFRTCMPFDRPAPAHRIRRVSEDSYIVTSESRNLRYQGTLLFEPHQISNFPTSGPIAGLIGVVVGFSTPYLNAIEYRGRLVLNNGFHRVYALRELGATHVPCAILKLESLEELSVVAATDLARDPQAFLEAPRPPLLRDYFDPRVCRVVWLPARSRQVQVQFSIRVVDMPRD